MVDTHLYFNMVLVAEMVNTSVGLSSIWLLLKGTVSENCQDVAAGTILITAILSIAIGFVISFLK